MATTRLFRVFGTVTDVQNNPLDGLVIKVFDKDLRSEQLIGQTTTNRYGKYELRYDPAKFKHAEKKYPDLAVKVYASSGRKLYFEPTTGDIHYNAGHQEKINIKLPNRIQQDVIEFNHYINVTSVIRGDLSFDLLEENNKVQDLTFISRECEINRTHLDYMAVSFRIAKFTKIPAAFFYAIFRMETLQRQDLSRVLDLRFDINIDVDLQSLFYDIVMLDPKVIQTDISAAIKRRYIPAPIRRKFPEIMQILKRHRSKGEEFQKEVKTKRIYETLSNFVLDDKLSAITELYSTSGGDHVKFFADLASKNVFSSESEANNAQSSLILTEIFGYDNSILTQVKQKRRIRKPADIKKLVHLNETDWRDMFTNGEGIKVGSRKITKKMARVHAKKMVKSLEARFPSEAYIKHFSSDQKLTREDKQIVTFLKKNKDIDLKETKLDIVFKEKQLGDKKYEPLKNGLKRHQRLFKLTSDYEKAKHLEAQKIHSAQGVIAVGKSRFLNEVAPKVGFDKKEAEAVYVKAESINTAALLVAGDLQAINKVTGIPALASKKLALSMEKVGADFPNLKTLFSLTDICECEHCRSVYSPAAYLVELLQFLDKRDIVDTTTTPHTTGHLAKDKLFERRPDIGDLDLSCDNANTPVPYIDLVCEILEEQVSPNLGVKFFGTISEGAITNTLRNTLVSNGFELTEATTIYPPDVNGDYILRDRDLVLKLHNEGGNNWRIKELRQTYGTEASRSASPYYVNEGAYTALNTKQYAFSLPFDLHHTEAQAYFSRFGAKRSELMRSFQKVGAPSDAEIAAETLGLTNKEHKIIITADIANQQKYWNTSVANAADEMKVLGTMLDKTGLTYEQLQDMLELQFIKGSDKLFIKHLDNSCDLSQKHIENLNANALDRFHRFLRLWRALQWNMSVIDEVISQANLGNGTLDDNIIKLLSDISRVSQKTGIKTSELVGCYGTIPHDTRTNEDYGSLYHQVFLDVASNGSIDPKLKPDNIGGGGQLSDVQSSLSVTLQISEDDLVSLKPLLPDTVLSWGNLSTLYAASRFTKKYKINVEDYINYQHLTGVNAFSSPNTTLVFIKHLEHAKKSPLSAKEVRFILRHEAEDLNMKIVSDEKITEILQLIQEGIQQAFIENKTAFDQSMAVEELTAELKNSLLRLPEMTDEIANDFLRMSVDGWTVADIAADIFIDDHLSDSVDTAPIKSAQAAIGGGGEVEQKAFIESIVIGLANYLFELEKESTLVEILMEAFNQEEALVMAITDYAELGQPALGVAPVKALLTANSLIDVNNPEVLPPIVEATYQQQFNSLRMLNKLLPVWEAFAVAEEDLPWWLEHGPDMGWLSLDGMPYDAAHTNLSYTDWEALVLWVDLSKKYTPVANPSDPETPITFHDTLELLSPTAATSKADW
ncbi:MAG: hypothetical protein AAF901_02215, partial [Bacteroidota bacterium]